jgi:hypothetical protein
VNTTDVQSRYGVNRSHGCGCCGRPHGRAEHFCGDCEPHLVPRNRYLPPWERTWFAQTGRPCVFSHESITAPDPPPMTRAEANALAHHFEDRYRHEASMIHRFAAYLHSRLATSAPMVSAAYYVLVAETFLREEAAGRHPGGIPDRTLTGMATAGTPWRCTRCGNVTTHGDPCKFCVAEAALAPAKVPVPPEPARPSDRAQWPQLDLLVECGQLRNRLDRNARSTTPLDRLVVDADVLNGLVNAFVAMHHQKQAQVPHDRRRPS